MASESVLKETEAWKYIVGAREQKTNLSVHFIVITFQGKQKENHHKKKQHNLSFGNSSNYMRARINKSVKIFTPARMMNMLETLGGAAGLIN